MLPRLDAERTLEAANLRLVTADRVAEDHARTVFFENLQHALDERTRSEKVVDHTMLANEGIVVILEDEEGNPIPRSDKGTDES